MVFEKSDGGYLILLPDVLATFDRFRQNKPKDKEACGVLIGSLKEGLFEIFLELATSPQPNDIRSRMHFWRSPSHQKIVERIFRESQQTRVYLGEWHTHPEADPTPSTQDWSAWRHKLSEQTEPNPLFFAIQGIRVLRIWQGDVTSQNIKELKYKE